MNKSLWEETGSERAGHLLTVTQWVRERQALNASLILKLSAAKLCGVFLVWIIFWSLYSYQSTSCPEGFNSPLLTTEWSLKLFGLDTQASQWRGPSLLSQPILCIILSHEIPDLQPHHLCMCSLVFAYLQKAFPSPSFKDQIKGYLFHNVFSGMDNWK